MKYHLPAHVSFGLVGPHAIVLDLALDRYFLLDPMAAAVLAALGTCEGECSPSADVQALVRRGFVQPGAGPPVRPVEATSLQESALESRRSDGTLPLRHAFFLRIHVGFALRWRGLAATIDRLRRLRMRLGKGDFRRCPDEAGYIARGYCKARILVPAKRLCVPDSLALGQALWRRGIAADIYFGVRLNPFAAHAWVQQSDLVLSDPLNIVADYSPVFRL